MPAGIELAVPLGPLGNSLYKDCAVHSPKAVARVRALGAEITGYPFPRWEGQGNRRQYDAREREAARPASRTARNSPARSAATRPSMCGQTSGGACFFRPSFCAFAPFPEGRQAVG
jgi:hypothetical protein